ncbi:hypothetical protein [Myroides odoratimimus]|uniref:hypothetical protein n=1 Tax=Myroides odoratimimus TaxID=76832 RepID=UPI002578227A|nr:hypothetical protein [Myroides odoratimimus]
MNINFTDSTIQAALIGVIGALIAGFGAAYITIKLTDRKEKKQRKEHLDTVRLAVINLLSNEYLYNLEQLKESTKKLGKFIHDKHDEFNLNIATNWQEEAESHSEELLSFNDTHFLKFGLLVFFDKDDLLKIFVSKNIEVSILYGILNMYERIANENPLKIYDSYDSEYEKIAAKNQEGLKNLYSMYSPSSDIFLKEERSIKQVTISNLHSLFEETKGRAKNYFDDLNTAVKYTTMVINNLK